MTQNNAFHRSRSMMAAISAILATGISGMALQTQLAGIGPYRSRGKGHNKGFIKTKQGNYCNNARTNMPHQGKRECARRVARRLALAE